MAIETETDVGPVNIGDLFQGYQIVKLLGQGGYASVYHARREFIGRDVAIKISNRAVTREVFKRFQSEARFTHRLDHPNIVKVEDAAVATSGHLYIVMELLRGQTFWDARKQYGRLTIPEALHLCAQAADGVEQAHRSGAIHRDLKPLNLFIIADNRVKVLDFGIAKIPDDGDGSSTQRNIVHGTLKYMSADQLMGRTLTAHSDIYALGVILFELISGRHPHIAENARPTEAELGFAIVSRPAASLATIDPSIPSYIVEVVERALSRETEKQFASMAAFAEALRQCFETYIRECPQLAELRELWIPAPSASAVVRSAEPPSQEHIATAVVAVVPPQSLRPTARIQTVPAKPAAQPPVANNASVQHQLAPTPAPLTGGVAVSPASTRSRENASPVRQRLTVRRIASVGAALGFVIGVSVTLARLPHVSTRSPASSTDTPLTEEKPLAAPVETPQPSATSISSPSDAVAPPPAPRPPPSIPFAPRRPSASAQPKSRPRAPDRKAEDRLNWFQEDNPSTNNPLR